MTLNYKYKRFLMPTLVGSSVIYQGNCFAGLKTRQLYIPWPRSRIDQVPPPTNFFKNIVEERTNRNKYDNNNTETKLTFKLHVI